jgi:hypothetical protein
MSLFSLPVDRRSFSNPLSFPGLAALMSRRGNRETGAHSKRREIAASWLEAEHLGSELDLDGSHGTIQTTRAAMPALVRILDHRKLLSLVKMDYIQRAMQVAGSAFLALLHIDHGGHGLLLSSPHRGGITS